MLNPQHLIPIVLDVISTPDVCALRSLTLLMELDLRIKHF